MAELNIIKYLQLSVPAAFVIVGGVLLHDAAASPYLLWLYAPLALVSFTIAVYLYRWAVENTHETLTRIQQSRVRSKAKVEKELTKRAEIRRANKIQEAQNLQLRGQVQSEKIQLRRQAETDKTVHRGIRKLLDI